MDKYREQLAEVLRLVSADLAVKLAALPPVADRSREPAWKTVSRLRKLRDGLTEVLEEASS